MSMLDSFFNKGFRAAKCKTLLKLTIPRIKLLRNRREIQIKQMRRDIAKLLETGQEATARIRVEHIIREENMMAAQEILELFCELIAVRLPIIETQRECPLDLKEAISSVCFAAPRCADLPELLQVQMLFASKYGKEFVAAAAELMPECGVNRQLIELLSVRAPSPDKKMKLLKEIAEEHELEWDPAASETELLKPHEDLLDGPTQFVSGSKLPLPKGKHEETLDTSPGHGPNEQSDTDSASDLLDLPEVPKVSLQPIGHSASAPEMLPMATALQPDLNHESSDQSPTFEGTGQEHHIEHKGAVDEKSETNKDEVPGSELVSNEVKQFVPFISPPSVSAPSVSARPSGSPPSILRMKSEANADLQDVLTAAQAAAETAERAAAAARSAATLAQARISELTKKNSEKFPDISGDENPFHVETSAEMPHFKHKYSFGDPDAASSFPYSHSYPEERKVSELPDLPSLDKLEIKYDSPSNYHSTEQEYSLHQPQRSPSMDDESYFSYPNLFTSQNSGRGSNAQSVNDNFRSSH